MKMKAIIAEPLELDAAGVKTQRQAAVFIHIGRCGLVGTTIPEMTRCLPFPSSTLTAICNVLHESKLIVSYAKHNAQGRTNRWVVTVRGWAVLTAPADFSMFAHAREVLA